jgi:hypothetical protein
MLVFFAEYPMLAAEDFIPANNSGVYGSKSRHKVSPRIVSIFCNVATLLNPQPPHIAK